jgi:hypothetical protein
MYLFGGSGSGILLSDLYILQYFTSETQVGSEQDTKKLQQSLEVEIMTLSSRLKSEQQMRENNEQRVVFMEEALSKEQSKRAEAEASVLIAQERIQKLENDKSSLEKSLKLELKSATRVRKDKEDAEKALAEMKSTLEDTRKELMQLKQKLNENVKEAELSNRSTTARLEQEIQAKNDLQKKYNELRFNNKGLVKAEVVADLNKQIEELKLKLEQSVGNHLDLLTITNLETLESNLMSALKKLSVEKQKRWNQMLEDQHKIIQQLEDEKRTLQNSKDKMQTILDTKLSETKDYKEQLERTEEELTRQRKVTSSLLNPRSLFFEETEVGPGFSVYNPLTTPLKLDLPLDHLRKASKGTSNEIIGRFYCTDDLESPLQFQLTK